MQFHGLFVTSISNTCFKLIEKSVVSLKTFNNLNIIDIEDNTK